MRRLAWIAMLAGCPSPSHKPDAAPPDAQQPPDAQVDAFVADAAPPDAPGPQGAWRLQTETFDDGGVLPSPDGILSVKAPSLFALATISTLNLLPVDALVDAYTLSSDLKSFQLSSGTVPFTWTGSNLSFTLGTETFDFAKLTYTPTDLFTVTGTVTLADPASPPAHPHAAIVYLLRGVGAGGENGFVADPRDDVALTFDGSGKATFDLSRDRGALGISRIVWTTKSFTSVGLLVVYDDADGDNNLTVLYGSCGANQDCVRGISPILLAYRTGDPVPARYDGLLTQWSPAIVVSSLPDSMLGAASLDPTITVPFDVAVPGDPSTVVVPQLPF